MRALKYSNIGCCHWIPASFPSIGSTGQKRQWHLRYPPRQPRSIEPPQIIRFHTPRCRLSFLASSPTLSSATRLRSCSLTSIHWRWRRGFLPTFKRCGHCPSCTHRACFAMSIMRTALGLNGLRLRTLRLHPVCCVHLPWVGNCP